MKHGVEIGPDTPLRLKTAVEVAFPLGGMTVSGLRREAKKGHLAIEEIAGKQFTTLRHIEEMREKCRVEAKGHDSGSSQPEKTENGKIIEQAVWVIRDGSIKRSTGCGPREIEQAEGRLRDYLNAKPTERIGDRDPSAVLIADVVAIYSEDVVRKHARPKETAARLENVLDFFGDKLSPI